MSNLTENPFIGTLDVPVTNSSSFDLLASPKDKTALQNQRITLENGNENYLLYQNVHLIPCIAVFVFSVIFPVPDVNSAHSTYHELKFTLSKVSDVMFLYDFSKPFHNHVHLFLLKTYFY